MHLMRGSHILSLFSVSRPKKRPKSITDKGYVMLSATQKHTFGPRFPVSATQTQSRRVNIRKEKESWSMSFICRSPTSLFSQISSLSRAEILGKHTHREMRSTRKISSLPPSDIHFYHQDSPYGCFSNFYRADIVIDGKTWPTTEHYFQAMKFSGEDEALVERIRALDNPGKAAAMGRNRNFPLRKDWDQDYVGADGKLTRFKLEVMRTALRAKFDQHADIQETLLATRGRHLVERTARDRYWGDGGDGSGKNMLGKLLVELREVLIREEEEKKKQQEAVSHPASF